MDSFFKTIKTSFNSRETTIKQTILTNLSDNAKEMQFDYKENKHEQMVLSDITTSFCTTIESLYLHGLKDSFIRQTINVIAGDVDRKPEPNFWPLLLIISHKQIIEHISSMSQLNSDIGYCRAWIRQSLNDGLLSSYINTIRKNSSSLSPYYQRYAFIRDSDLMEVTAKILEGIETCIRFIMPCNSSLLNYWPDNSLQMAGIWISPIRSCTISSGVDIVSTLTDEERINEELNQKIPEIPIETPETDAITFYNKYHKKNKSISEEDHMDMFLSKVDEMDYKINSEIETVIETEEDELNLIKQQEIDDYNKQQNEEINSSVSVSGVSEIDEQLINTKTKITNSQMGNSIISKSGWSSIDDDKFADGECYDDENSKDTNIKKNNIEMSRSNSMTTSVSSLKLPLDKYSYNQLLLKYQSQCNKNIQKIDLNDLWERFESSLGGITDENRGVFGTSSNDISNEIGDNLAEELEFVEVPAITDKFSLQELHSMVEKTCKLAREQGLDAQGYICKSCANPLGFFGFSKAQVCSFSGDYYCDSCMSTELFIIPSKIIYNWDFKKYPVSLTASSFLLNFQYQPFIDFKLLNPDIYTSINEMAILKSLRIQLSFIRAYLFTCCESIIEKLQKQIWTKEYLHEHIHRYSIADLTLIQKGNLVQLIEKTVQFGEEHIRECSLCSQKGFICEVCNSPKVLYPFDIATTYRCDECGAVFHCECLNATMPCPKCDRKKKREDLPLLDIY